MIEEELGLTKREERVLRSVVSRLATDPVSRYFQRPIKGVTGVLAAVIVVVVTIGMLVFIATYGIRWSQERDNQCLLVSCLFFYLAIEKWFQVPVRERLIRKLYNALDKGVGSLND
jgi:hypothetical protein